MSTTIHIAARNRANRFADAQVPSVSVSVSNRWLAPVLTATVLGLFFLAVFAAGVSIRASYTLAELNQRRSAALREQQALQEELAHVTSLAYTEIFASEFGFTEQVSPVASLEVTTPVAQR